MGALCGKLRAKFDADELFSYKTVKLVVIKDKRLGIIHHALQIIIFIYIVVYTILYQQRYLLLEAPYGSVRTTLQEPPTWPNVNDIPYCSQSAPSYGGFDNLNCAYFIGTDLTYPPGKDGLMVSTRVKDTFYNIPTDPFLNCTNPPTSLACVPVPQRATQKYYVAGIDNYTVYMEHAIFGRQNKLITSSTQCEGKFLFPESVKEEPISFDDPARLGDIIPLSTMLKAAQIKLDDSSGLGNNTYRYDGVFIVVVVTYTNYVTRPAELHYTYELFAIPNLDVLMKQPSEATDYGFKQRNWYGVNFVFMIVGSIGYFDFPTLLTSLVNGTVLIKVAATIVDMLILHVMPDKASYSKHKFEKTDAFGKIRREKMNRESSLSNTESNMSVPLLGDDYNPPPVKL